MSQSEIFHKLESIDKLPTLPVIIYQIQKLIGSKDTNMSQIGLVIAKDQAIAARVIRLVNSAFYGFREHIGSIKQGIVILGLNTIRNLVIGVSIVKAFEDSARISLFDRERFWLHSFGTALGAKLIARHMQRKEPEDYFLAGLLHDIGILLLDQFLHEQFVDIIKLSMKEKSDYRIAEEKGLGVGHGEIGAFLARKWKLPEMLTSAIRYHHQPTNGAKELQANQDIVTIVHVADAMVQQLSIGQFIENFHSQCEGQALRYLKIQDKTVLEGIAQKVKLEVKNLMKEWGL